MSLDRQSIEKRDFPIGRRGYDSGAVDAHLARVADELERLHRAAAEGGGGGAASLAQAAAEQVRTIVEAAETSAADIARQARDEAERVQRDADSEAHRLREEAVSRSQEHIGRVRESTQLMLQRVDAMENELSALLEALRTGANRLNADLSLLQGNMGELYDATHQEPVAAPAPPPPAAPVGATAADLEEALIQPEPVRVPEPQADEPEPVTASAGGGGADVEGARLVALNMALNGQSREETDRYLAENFDISDRSSLLDEVYSTVEG